MDFVRAVQGASKKEPSIQALMVGDGPLRQTCEDFARSHNVPVTFAGFLNQSQIIRAYAITDVLVLPSVGETWGLVVNEAMACSRPCLVSDRVGCGPDLVVPEETGVVFPHSDVPALEQSLLKLTRNPSQIAAMGAKGKERLGNYSIGAAVEGVLQALASAVGPSGKSCPC
jgi:glycosyltransferase involved in cell wall biosynthesis